MHKFRSTDVPGHRTIAPYERLDDDRYVEEYVTMETWLGDNIPVPGEVFREFIKYLYPRNLLVQNKLPVGRLSTAERQGGYVDRPVSHDALSPCSVVRAVKATRLLPN